MKLPKTEPRRSLVNRSTLILLLLLLFALAVRIGYLFEGVIPFSFDHGKDSLAVMHLTVTKSPVLIGPWTSIPGLYFGPTWYYLLAPAYLIGNFHPVAGVAMMVLLILIQVWLAYKYFGKYTALIIATAPFWVMISTSAWNPFPMTLITLVILILLKLSKKSGFLTPKYAFFLGLAASFGFHFSAAFAIFYPLIILAIIFLTKIKFSVKTIFLALIGFLLPFLPQIAFELRHDFVQTKAVLQYFKEGETHAFSVDKIRMVITATYGELKNGIVPEFRTLPQNYNSLIQSGWLLILVAVWLFLFKKRDQKTLLYTKFFLAFLIIPVIGFFFLHFNLWYVYAITPALAVLVGNLISKSRQEIRYVFTLLLVATPIISYLFYFGGNKADLAANRGFLPIKLEAIDEIRTKANGRPFSSYHYVPDIYDFSYQYLYLMQGFQNQKLPTEFSYKPGAPVYITQKTEIMEKLPESVKTADQPGVIFYIVEQPENPDFLDSWWQEQSFGEIISTQKLSPTVTLYEATPPEQIQE